MKVGTPWTNGGAPAISAAFLTALENVLVQPSGGSESGHYFAAGAVYTSGALVNTYVQTISRTATPISVTVDTADVAPTGGMSSPATAQLTSAGFQIYSLATTGPNVNARCGGAFTVNY